jgi:NADPH-dependent 2,4-dienoyl-CoA reductase/sulfur reductase-like enzyme
MSLVAVVGAGPAGLAAAAEALRAGADVALLDAYGALGGQFWRHLPESRPARRESMLQHDWSRYTALAGTVTSHPRCQVLVGAQVWALDRPGERLRLHLATGEADGADRTMTTLEPDALVLATGAHDLTLPFPGWDLPGVVSCGAAQAMAKAERLAVGEKVVVAGAGPFLLPVATALAATGAQVTCVLEASRVPALASGWLRGADALAIPPGKLRELAGYTAGLLRSRIPFRAGRAVVAAHGTDRVESVTVAALDASWAPIPGTGREVACDAVAVSHGFLPRLELAIAAGCELAGDGPWSRFAAVDADQRTSVPGIFAAGEVTGIGGAGAALREGAVAGWIAGGGSPAAPRAVAARRGAARYRALTRRLAAAHGIRPGWRQWLADDTVVCRCEEVSFLSLRATAAATGSRSLRALKLSTRAGLGPCQGRICGRTVEALLTRDGADPFLDGVIPDRRPVAAPVRFSELARAPRSAPACHPQERQDP